MWSNISKRIIYFVLFGYCLIFSYKSEAKTEKASSLKLDTAHVDVRKLTDDERTKLMEDKNYRYDRIGPAPKSMWDRFWEWVWRQIGKIFESKGGMIGWHIFEYSIIVAALVLVIVLLLKNNIRALFYGKGASVDIDFKEFDNDINKINFNKLIEEAISKKDFRKAVRLHFLQLLKGLAEHNVIKWQIDKTNSDYSMELLNTRYSKLFNELAISYEFIWYGDFHLDEPNFRKAIEKFKEFKVGIE